MQAKRFKQLSGWGNYPRYTSDVITPWSLEDIRLDSSPMICRGQGRSYGDCALLAQGHVFNTTYCNRFIQFDNTTGVLTAEAGTTLADILATFVPRGWFPPVMPGTQYVSLGGLVATDCHGKNHYHAGSFGNHVTQLTLLTAKGLVICSPEQHTSLFYATLGGMGLTGVITEVTFQLKKINTPYFHIEQYATCDLATTLTILKEQSEDVHYTAAWLDCLSRGTHLGRGIVLGGTHADSVPNRMTPHTKTRRTIPSVLPFSPLTTCLVSTFNASYYQLKKRQSTLLAHYQPFFFPLDAVHHWNRLYGRSGFIQYQCAIPEANALTVFQTLITEFQTLKLPVYLAVLKRLSSLSQGMLSFPLCGYTLSLDIPFSERLLPELTRMDEYIIKHQGRVYLAKDACLKAEHFKAMYPSIAAWQTIKSHADPQQHFQSAQSQRLEITP